MLLGLALTPHYESIAVLLTQHVAAGARQDRAQQASLRQGSVGSTSTAFSLLRHLLTCHDYDSKTVYKANLVKPHLGACPIMNIILNNPGLGGNIDA